MNITLLCVGKLKETYWVAACQEYIKRLSKFTKIRIIEVNEEKTPEESPALIQQSLQKEGKRLLEQIKKEDYVILLSLQGKSLTSEAFAQILDNQMTQGTSSFCFVIGGSYGTSQEVEQRAQFQLKLGDLTFPHQLVRVMLLEIIYRSFKIMNHEPYHK